MIDLHSSRSAAATAGVARYLATQELSVEALSDPKVQAEALNTLNALSLSATFGVEDVAAAQALLAEQVASKTGKLRDASSTKGTSATFGGSSSLTSPMVARFDLKSLQGDDLPVVQKLLAGDAAALGDFAKTLGTLSYAVRHYDLPLVMRDRGFVMALLDVAKAPGPRAADKLGEAAQQALGRRNARDQAPTDLGLMQAHTATRPRTEPRLTGLLHALDVLPAVAQILSLTTQGVVALAGPAFASAAQAAAGKAVLTKDERTQLEDILLHAIPLERLPRYQSGHDATAGIIRDNPGALGAQMRDAASEYIYLSGAVDAVVAAVKGAGPEAASRLANAALAVLTGDSHTENFERVRRAVVAEGGTPSTKPDGERALIPWALGQLKDNGPEASDAVQSLRALAETAGGAGASHLLREVAKAIDGAGPKQRSHLRGVLEVLAKQDGGNTWWSRDAAEALQKLPT